AELTTEKGELETLVGDEGRQWKAVTAQIREIKKKWGPLTALGKRRTTFEAPPAASADFDLADVLVEREPITVVVTQKGWIRALKGQVSDLSNLQFKGDDSLRVSFFAETTSKILVLATDGKIFTLDAAKLPGGRGAGEPIRLLADIDDGEDVAAVFVHRPGGKMVVAASDGRGFRASQDDMIGNTKKGRMLLNVDPPAKARFIIPVEGDHVAAIGENRKLLCFPLEEIPEMTRGKGVRLQRYRDGGLSDIKTFALADGLGWIDPGGRVFNVAKENLTEWLGHRAEAGRLPPKGFPKANRFG
uniref:DNA gyrase C-terminal beta-propeller domain-containing protein n=1 Tax=Rhodoblastus sp. TaxID=1962975 RepID=UPI003F9A010D